MASSVFIWPGLFQTDGSGAVVFSGGSITFASSGTNLLTLTAEADGVLDLIPTTTSTSRPLFRLGGTSSAFPALRRQGAAFEFVTANEGAYANVVAAAYGMGSPGSGLIFSTGAGLINISNAAVTSLALFDVSASTAVLKMQGNATGAKYLAMNHDGTNGVIDTAASAGLLSIAPTNATSVTIGKAISSLNGLATTGNGVPLVVASARSTAQTGAVVSVATYTPTADSSFKISANVLVTTATSHTFTATCTYTDEGNTARTVTLPFMNVAGSAIVNSIANASGAVPYMGIPLQIRAKASTAITIATTGTFTTVTYNVEGTIHRIA